MCFSSSENATEACPDTRERANYYNYNKSRAIGKLHISLFLRVYHKEINLITVPEDQFNFNLWQILIEGFQSHLVLMLQSFVKLTVPVHLPSLHVVGFKPLLIKMCSGVNAQFMKRAFMYEQNLHEFYDANKTSLGNMFSTSARIL